MIGLQHNGNSDGFDNPKPFTFSSTFRSVASSWEEQQQQQEPRQTTLSEDEFINEEMKSFNDASALRGTLLIYGNILVLVVILYSYLRRRYPKVYAVRSWVEKARSYLADDQYHFFSWMWRVYFITDDEIMHECGMDACCYIRLIQMGYRLSLVGVFNMLWLLPVYRTASESAETEGIDDPVVQTTVANVSSGSDRLYATVFAAYIMFGYTMYLILQEFDWYTEQRHKFLARPKPENYAVFVRNIPRCYRDNKTLVEFFRICFSDDAVLEARLAINVPSLVRLVASRKATLAKLEHAHAVYQKTGVRARHYPTVGGIIDDKKVDSIYFYENKLARQNKNVAEKIALYVNVVDGRSSMSFIHHQPPPSPLNVVDLEPNDEPVAAPPASPAESLTIPQTPQSEPEQHPMAPPLGRTSILSQGFGSVLDLEVLSSADAEFVSLDEEDDVASSSFSGDFMAPIPEEGENIVDSSKRPGKAPSFSFFGHSLQRSVSATKHVVNRGVDVSRAAGRAVTASATQAAGTAVNQGYRASMVAGRVVTATANTAKDAVVRASHQTTDVVLKAGQQTTGAVLKAGRDITRMLVGDEGDVRSAGFVVFKKLSTTNAALQMVHHSSAFSMEILNAPHPKDVNWSNIGRTHKDIQLGNLGSLVLTTGLCLLWTIPMSFFASLSNASLVREDVESLDRLFTRYPGLIPVTEQLAPLLVVVSNSVLPIILEHISQLEGPISLGMLEASKFTKLAAFSIIQTFFVSAISGSVIQTISDIIDDWTKLIDLLANSLPSQGTYFMQILLVSTTMTAAMELLRVVPLVLAFLRSKIGPNLTEKERKTTVMGLRPLADPREFEHAEFAAQLVLYFMVLFVYTVISPITPLITALCFAFMGTMFRTQFMYIYPKYPDSGGKMWASFIQILLTCMIIAQTTILGLLGLKKGAVQFPLFLPLMYITMLFNLYIRQRHFNVAAFLPTRECVKADLKLGEDEDHAFLRGAYTQPEMAATTDLVPEIETTDDANEEKMPLDEENVSPMPSELRCGRSSTQFSSMRAHPSSARKSRSRIVFYPKEDMPEESKNESKGSSFFFW